MLLKACTYCFLSDCCDAAFKAISSGLFSILARAAFFFFHKEIFVFFSDLREKKGLK